MTNGEMIQIDEALYYKTRDRSNICNTTVLYQHSISVKSILLAYNNCFHRLTVKALLIYTD
jgi:hypothetical protein